jgi:D-arabinitol 4-dehydrogenase
MNKAAKAQLYATGYDRAMCKIGVVHVGFGAFHRAHQAVYIDDYMQETDDLRWGIAAVNLRSRESADFAAAQSSDGYILKYVSPEGEANYRCVRPHVMFSDWAQDPHATEALMALPDVHMVTITVTESGYYLDDTGALNASDPVIAAEIAGTARASVYAYLAAGLRARMEGTAQPLSILCCDNIRGNGHMLQRNLASYLALSGQQDLEQWVQSQVTFPCSMVDRITPRTTAGLTHEIDGLFGREQSPPVLSESFIQWVLEDRFAGPMPDLARAGVTVVADVDPYEEAKIRILNGGHTCLTYLAALAGHTTFDQAMQDADLRAHFMNYETKEVLPALTMDLPFDKADYLDQIAQRFSNSAIADSISRICADGYSKFSIFIRPTLEGCLVQGRIPHYGLTSVASWYVFARHIATGALALDYAEPNWASLSPLLTDGAEKDFVTSRMLWADLPSRFPEFSQSLLTHIKEMESTWPA